eukprot:comp19153_c0_seq1/m.21832 comp19153_c0_seq1/g.21832  ORF comp19153_c0_seq1/g.21832 comp19153_c0_seq1/m.21832 type:complete len:214 (-) comp19153_c0_seq1:372-1013(-)
MVQNISNFETYLETDTLLYCWTWALTCVGSGLVTGILLSRNSSGWDKFSIYWFSICAFIHFFLEGSMVVLNDSVATREDIFGATWREYGRGDARYITSDGFTVIMEGITAFFDGPVALLVAVAISRRSHFRYPFQLMVSICQLYGCILYFGIEIFEGFKSINTGSPFHFWVYFFLMNFIWIVIPLTQAYDSAKFLLNACKLAQQPIANGKKRH